MALNIVFAGTPEFAAEHLKVLISSGHSVIAAYSQPDRPAGRGRKLTSSPVKALALEHDIPIYQPLNFKTDEAKAELAALQPDLLVVVAYGLILPQAVLDIPRLGCINVHASLLPRWRGAAPIHRALLAGDEKTGVTIMQMALGLDTGDMLVKVECDILPTDTSQVLHDRLIEIGGPALLDALNQLESGTATPEVQDDSLATYAHKLEKAEGLIDWSQSASEIDRKIRGLTPWPGAYTLWQGETVRIHKAHYSNDATAKAAGSVVDIENTGLSVATGSGLLIIESLQMPGKKAMPVRDILNGKRDHFEAHPTFG